VQAQVNDVAHKKGWDALLSLGYAYASGKTTLVHRQHHGPLMVQKALYPEGSAVCHSIILHPPGGIAGGDTLAVSLRLEPYSQALLTSPGAGKWYRSSGSYASQQLRFSVEENAVLEWLPQETILFDGALSRMNMEVELAQGAVFMGWEILCLGRAASGEKFNHGHLNQRVRIKFAGKPIWQEFGNLQGGDALMNSPAGLAGCTVTATLILAGKAIPAELLNLCREVAVDGMAGEHCGITVLPDVLIARYLGNKSEAAKQYFTALWTILRPYAAGRQAVIPRIWQT
jgi:urease accessory protein